MKKLFKIDNGVNIAYCTCPEETSDNFMKLLGEQDFCKSAEMFSSCNVPLEQLPAEIVEKVKSILKAFDSCNVIYEHNEFHVSTAIAICAEYAWDHMFVNEYKAAEVYTPEQRRENFKESFGYYPTFKF